MWQTHTLFDLGHWWITHEVIENRTKRYRIPEETEFGQNGKNCKRRKKVPEARRPTIKAQNGEIRSDSWNESGDSIPMRDLVCVFREILSSPMEMKFEKLVERRAKCLPRRVCSQYMSARSVSETLSLRAKIIIYFRRVRKWPTISYHSRRILIRLCQFDLQTFKKFLIRL